MSNNGGEFAGNIECIRAVEDCIRATKKYTEGIGTMRKQHPMIQGEDFPSKVFCKYYEVYPNTELSWNMPAGEALDWLWGETLHIDVMFKYDYRVNKASLSVREGESAVRELVKSIPNFGDVLKAITNGNGKANEV